MYWCSMFASEVMIWARVMLPSMNWGIKSVSSPKLLVRVGESSAVAAICARATVATYDCIVSRSVSNPARTLTV